MGAKPKFKVGDIVRCVKADEYGELTFGKNYTVVGSKEYSDVNTKVTTDKGMGTWFYGYRFELVNSPEFKVGDRVRCVMGDHYGGLKKGHEYTIKNIISDYIYVDESEEGPTGNGWLPERFELVKDWNSPKADVKDEEILANAAEANSVEGIVTKPAHYTRWKIEPVEFLLKNDVPGHIFNIVKYVMRAGYKLYPNQDAVQSEITDLKKAARYIEMRINLLEGKEVL